MSPPPLRSCACQRLQPRRAAAPRRARRPARACRRSSRGCRCQPAPASRGAASCSPRPASRCRSTAPGSLLDPSRLRGRHRARGRSDRSPPVLVSVYLQGGIDSMSVLYPAGDPLYPQYRADARARPRTPGPVFTEDPRLHWHPLAAPLAAAPRRGQGQRAAGRRLHRSQPVALHQPPLLGGRRHPGRPADRLDGPLPRPRRRRRQPAAGPVPRRVAAAGARDRAACRSRRSTLPSSYSFYAQRASGGRRRRPCTTASTRSARSAHAPATPPWRSPGRPR